MDPDGHIYLAPEDEIPGEDKARLEGYLRARAEQDRVSLLEERAAQLEELRRSGPSRA